MKIHIHIRLGRVGKLPIVFSRKSATYPAENTQIIILSLRKLRMSFFSGGGGLERLESKGRCFIKIKKYLD